MRRRTDRANEHRADSSNRAIEIVAESSDFYRSSTIVLNGDQAPRTSVFEFRGLPGGKYEIRARLLDASGEPRASVYREINVVSNGR